MAGKEKKRWQRAFLAQLGVRGIVSDACKKAGVSRAAAYSYRQDHPDFGAQWANAYETAMDSLEQEAYRRGVEGYDEPLAYQGNLTGDVVRKYSDTLLIFLLNGGRPAKYRQRHELEHTGEINFTWNLPGPPPPASTRSH